MSNVNAAGLNSIEFLGTVLLAGGGGAAVAFGLFRTFGTKWLDSKFAASLARLKHEQNQEIEQLRFRINGMLDRSSKLAHREFEVLPDWLYRESQARS